MWNEQNWTLVSMPVTSTRAQWDEGLRTVRQFNDLLRVLPPIPQAIAGAAVARRSGSPSRPLTPAPARSELPPGRADLPPGRADVGRYAQPRPEAGRADPLRRPPPPPSRNGRQSPHYQR
jgi:hypothetical protein